MREWDAIDIEQKDHIQSLETLQIAEYADYLGVPISWVRAHCTPRDLATWIEHQEIKEKRRQKRRAKMEAGN